MTLLSGVDHVHVITPDLDRLLRFYRSVFDAPAVLDRTDDGLRQALIDVGSGVLIEALEQSEIRRAPRDYFALSTPSREAFLEVRRRLMEAGAADGAVRDITFMWTFHFQDPDGTEGEVVWRKPGTLPSDAPLRRDWAVVQADDLV